MKRERQISLDFLILYGAGILYFLIFKKHIVGPGLFIYFYVSTMYLAFKFINKKYNKDKTYQVGVFIFIVMFLVSALLFNIIDNKRFSEDKRPLFAILKYETNYYKDFTESNRYSTYDVYQGLGYKMVYNNMNKSRAKFDLFGRVKFSVMTHDINIGTDSYYGLYLKSNDNDIRLHLDGIEEFQVDVYGDIIKGVYKIIDDEKIEFVNDDKTKWSCEIDDNKLDLNCDKYAEIFMK